MNAAELAKQAALSTCRYVGVLSDDLCHKLELSYIAQWLDDQTVSVRAAAANTACKAIEQLRAVYVRNGGVD
jgi:hypothetical protein